jgi:hypothetical protein
MVISNQRLAEKAPPMKETPQITYKLVDEENRPIRMIELPPERRSLWKRMKGWF